MNLLLLLLTPLLHIVSSTFHPSIVNVTMGRALVLHDYGHIESRMRVDFAELELLNKGAFNGTILADLCGGGAKPRRNGRQKRSVGDYVRRAAHHACEATSCSDAVHDFLQMKQHLSDSEIGIATLLDHLHDEIKNEDIEDLLYHHAVPHSLLDNPKFVKHLIKTLRVPAPLFATLSAHDIASMVDFLPVACPSLAAAEIELVSPNFYGAEAGVIRKIAHKGTFTRDKQKLLRLDLPAYAVTTATGDVVTFNEDDCEEGKSGIFMCVRRDLALKEECDVRTLAGCSRTLAMSAAAPGFFRYDTFGFRMLIQTRIKQYMISDASESRAVTVPDSGIFMLELRKGASAQFGDVVLRGASTETTVEQLLQHDLLHLREHELAELESMAEGVAKFTQWSEPESSGKTQPSASTADRLLEFFAGLPFKILTVVKNWAFDWRSRLCIPFLLLFPFVAILIWKAYAGVCWLWLRRRCTFI